MLGELGTRPVRVIVTDQITKAGEWLDYKIQADCTTGKYSVAVNGRQVVEDAAFAEASSTVYALSFRTGKSHGRPRGRTNRDLKNVEHPLEKVVYRIDDVKTGNP
ncbi:MAG: hypothetical protein ACYTBJ_26165 [Planctomycetota bacterium]